MAHTNDVELVDNAGWDERILVCRNGRLVRTFIVVTARYVVLVDTLINPQTALKMVELAQPYLQNGRQLLVVNTHADYDHCWGNQVFAGAQASTLAPIIGNRLSPPIFDQPESREFFQKMKAEEPNVFSEVVLTPPTILFDEQLAIDGGDLTLGLLATPGHTVDHTSLFIPEIKTLLAADAAEVPYPVARTPEGLPEMRRSLSRLAALEAEAVLYCHAPVTMGPQLLRDNIAYFDVLEARCRAALAQGVSDQPDEDEDVIALVNCPWEEAAPTEGIWERVHEYYRTQGHAAQIRTMLRVLGGES